METERSQRAPRIRRSSQRKRQPSEQQIQYTQPKPFFRNRLIVQLLSIAAVVPALTMGISIFFKVDTVFVAGATKHSAHTIVRASDIEPGDSLLFFGRAKAAGKIKTALPYVDTVRFELKLPGTLYIIVEEKMLAYALQAMDGSWWMMTSDGVVAEKIDAATAEESPVIEGVILQSPEVGAYAVAAETASEGGGVTTAADRLTVAVKILEQLEAKELFSPDTRLDVSDLFALRLYCGPDHRVELGGSEDMDKKIEIVKGALVDLEGNSGVLKLTYDETEQKWLVVFQPWSKG